MMKNAILMLLLVASFSFAKPPLPPPDLNYAHGHVFLHAICTYNQIGYLLYQAQENYRVYDGEDCVSPDLKGHDDAVFESFYGEGGLAHLYQTLLWECEEGQNSPGCYAAQRSFYSGAKSARDVFLSAKIAYMLSANRAVYANNKGLCRNSIPGIMGDIAGSSATYRECMHGPN